MPKEQKLKPGVLIVRFYGPPAIGKSRLAKLLKDVILKSDDFVLKGESSNGHTLIVKAIL